MPRNFDSTEPAHGDSENILLAKMLQQLGGSPKFGASNKTLLAGILIELRAGAGAGSSSPAETPLVLRDALGHSSVDLNGRQLLRSTELPSVNWQTYTLRDGTSIRVNWLSGILADSTGAARLQWEGGLGFFGAEPITRPVVAGSRAVSEQALASLITALAALGLITDSTTA